MKKTVWGYRKASVFLSIAMGNPIYKRGQGTKARCRRILRLKMKELRPTNGYPVYSVSRSKPHFTIKSQNDFEDSKHYWKEWNSNADRLLEKLKED